ncbi:type IV pilus modification protein PilV [Saccharospirillum mangrovi]|uniref:type IV pilus modification protein PilV n=1 Tax=Saccharospirillum mangrovi TaxID=2161747 RepID=UPI001300261E
MLIAITILAIALLGFAQLQSRALSLNQEAIRQVQAALLADELFDRMRANRDYALSSNRYEFGPSTPVPVAPECETQVCSAAEIAQRDLGIWLQRFKEVLPAASATLERSGESVRLLIQWPGSETVSVFFAQL